MGYGLTLATLPGFDYRPLAVICHEHVVFSLQCEVCFRDLTPIDERQHKAIAQISSQLLHHIECKRWPPRAQRVEKPHIGVKPNSFESCHHIVANERVDKR